MTSRRHFQDKLDLLDQHADEACQLLGEGSAPVAPPASKAVEADRSLAGLTPGA